MIFMDEMAFESGDCGDTRGQGDTTGEGIEEPQTLG
jgi:hypothetical protein